MNVLYGQAFRIVALNQVVYRLDLVRALVNRYGFTRAPISADEIHPPTDSMQPLTFVQGVFLRDGKQVVIANLKLYMDSPTKVIAVDTHSTTDDADAVIDDVIAFGAAVVTDLKLRRSYVSHIEFPLEGVLEWGASLFTKSALGVVDRMRAYGGANEPAGAWPPALGLTSIVARIDPAKWVFPSEFTIERRVNVPWEANMYFSQAPLGTDDHIAVLKQFAEDLAKIGRGERVD